MNNDNRQAKQENKFLSENTRYSANSMNVNLSAESGKRQTIQPLENKIDVVEKLIDYLKRD